MRKRKRNRVDTTKLTPVELTKYRRRLEQVNRYLRAHREWEKKIKNGEIPKTMTFKMYRKGRPAVASDPLDYLNASSIERLELLIQELKETRVKETRLVQEIRGLTMKTQKPLGSPSLEIAG